MHGIHLLYVETAVMMKEKEIATMKEMGIICVAVFFPEVIREKIYF